MAALQGLKGLYADPQDTTDVMDEGVLEAKANPIASDHSQYGSQSEGYGGTVPSQSAYNNLAVYDGYDAADAAEFPGKGFNVPGDELDATPVTHVAPYPKGIQQISWDTPDGATLANIQMQELHGEDFGGVALNVGHAPAGHEEIAHYTTDRYTAPNENVLSSDIADQLRGSGDAGLTGTNGGNADTTQGYGQLNSLQEFQAGHSIRRVQHDTVHFDFTNTHGEQQVPFAGRHPVQQMPLDGPDSPYFDQGDIDGGNIPWEGRIGDPTPYEQPAEPTIVAATDETDVWAWQ
jgi:hypothetical protein